MLARLHRCSCSRAALASAPAAAAPLATAAAGAGGARTAASIATAALAAYVQTRWARAWRRPARRAVRLALCRSSTPRTPTPSRCRRAGLRDPRHAGARRRRGGARRRPRPRDRTRGGRATALAAASATGRGARRRVRARTAAACATWPPPATTRGARPTSCRRSLASQALEARLRAARPWSPQMQAGDHPALGRPADARRAREAARLPARGRAQPRRLSRARSTAWPGATGRAQGFVRGPDLRAPGPRLRLRRTARLRRSATSPDAVVAARTPAAPPCCSTAGPNRRAAGSLPDASLGPRDRARRAERPGRRTAAHQHGLHAAEEVDLTGRNSQRIADLTVVRLDDRLDRLTGLHAPGDRAATRALDAAATWLRPLQPRSPPAAAAPAHSPRLGRRKPPRPHRRDAGRGRAGPLRHAERAQPRQAAARR